MSNSQQTVCYRGIFYGLPVIPDSEHAGGLTAIVTGATGLSGYHMVKMLASSPRWGKIYCLSSRSPPNNFVEDLGDDTCAVEHLKVDFLSDPWQIASSLTAKVSHV
jgi:hypothetical protein